MIIFKPTGIAQLSVLLPLTLVMALSATDDAMAQQATQLEEIVVSGKGSGKGDPQSPKGPGVGFLATRTETATKTDTPILETPQAISVVTPQQIRDTGAQTISQAIGYNSGVGTQNFGFDPRSEQFQVRGFTTSIVGIYRDGLRQANAPFGRFLNDPQDLDRIEILKGPSSVLYGAGVPGGLVDLISKTPFQENFGYAAADFGSYNRKQTRIDINTQVGTGGNVWLRVAGLFRDSNTQVPDTVDNRAAISPALTFLFDGSTTLTLLGNYSGTRGSMWPYYIHTTQNDVLNLRAGDPGYDALRTNQNSFGYQFEHIFSDTFKFQQNFRTGYVGYDGTNVDEQFPIPPGTTIVPRYAQRTSDQLTTTAVDTRLQAKARTGPIAHTLVGGVDYFRQSYTEVLQFGATPGGGVNPLFGGAPSIDVNNPVYGTGPYILSPLFMSSPLVPNQRTAQTIDQVGVYGQEQLTLGGLHVNIGGREDYSPMRTDNLLTNVSTPSTAERFTGRAGALYLFDSGFAPYVSYATSFLPQPGTDFFTTPFKPTTGEQIEGGIKYAPPGLRTVLTGSYFTIANNNVLTVDPDHPGFSVQAGQIRSRGVEFEATIGLAPGLNGIASYTNLDVFVSKASADPSSIATLGKVPIGTARQLGAIFLDYTIQSGRFVGLGGGGGFRYVGRTFADQLNTLENNAIPAVDLLGHYDVGKLRFQVSVRNLADRRVPICNGLTCAFSTARIVLGSLTARW